MMSLVNTTRYFGETGVGDELLGSLAALKEEPIADDSDSTVDADTYDERSTACFADDVNNHHVIQTDERSLKQLYNWAVRSSRSHSNELPTCDEQFENPTSPSHYTQSNRKLSRRKVASVSKGRSDEKTETKTADVQKKDRLKNRPYINCDFCEYKCKEAYYMRIHVRRHTGERPYKCDQCDKSFTRTALLNAHLLTHVNEKSFQCELVDEDKLGLLEYCNNESKSAKPFQCKNCNEQFSEMEHLWDHRCTAKDNNGLPSLLDNSSTDPLEDSDEANFSDLSGANQEDSNVNMLRPHKCEYCDKTYSKIDRLKVHMRSHTGEKPYVCEYCRKSFARADHWKVHMRGHTGEKPYGCIVCGIRFASANVLRVHFKRHESQHELKLAKSTMAASNRNEKHNCTKCNKTFPTATLLSCHACPRHQSAHTCETCGRNFTRKTSLLMHIRLHSGEKPFACENCGMAFTRNKDLRIHLRKHDVGENPFVCMMCESKFNTAHRLMKHIQLQCVEGVETSVENRESFISGGPLTCSHCSQEFGNDYQLRIHLQAHGVVRSFNCRFCSKAFLSSSNRTAHERIHTGERPFKCSYCEKSFVQSASLNGHMKTHTGEKPFQCKYCSKAFARRYCLNVHLKVHGERKSSDPVYLCEFCGVDFAARQQLKFHMLSHMDIKLFRCKDCGQDFSKYKDFKEHTRVHEGPRGKVFACRICRLEFVTNSHRKHHMAMHDNVYENGAKQLRVKSSGEVEWDQVLSPGDENSKLPRKIDVNATGSDLLVCTLCRRKFNVFARLKFHLLMHDSKRRYKCRRCLTRFTSPYHAILHFYTRHKISRHQCRQCLKEFTLTALLQRHSAKHAVVVPLKLKRIRKPRTDGGLNSTRCSERPYICPECFRGCTTRNHLKNHFSSHQRAHVCTVCQKHLCSKSSLKGHMLKHTGEVPFTCQLCGRGFRSKTAINYHLRTHNNSAVSSRQSKLFQLANTMSIGGPIVGSELQCGRCLLELPTLDTLNEHMFTCCVMTNLTNANGNYERSEIGHQMVYRCDQCARNFSQLYNFERHLAAHSARSAKKQNAQLASVSASTKSDNNSLSPPPPRNNLPQHICSKCGLSFKTRNELRIHAKIHAVPKNDFKSFAERRNVVDKKQNLYSCMECSCEFSRWNSLRLHMLEHVGEKPFACHLCEKRFVALSKLNQHLKIHLQDKPHKCLQCSKGFTSATALKTHTLTHVFISI